MQFTISATRSNTRHMKIKKCYPMQYNKVKYVKIYCQGKLIKSFSKI